MAEISRAFYSRGFECFDERYLGKTLVYCGTLGTLPIEVTERLSERKGRSVTGWPRAAVVSARMAFMGRPSPRKSCAQIACAGGTDRRSAPAQPMNLFSKPAIWPFSLYR